MIVTLTALVQDDTPMNQEVGSYDGSDREEGEGTQHDQDN